MATSTYIPNSDHDLIVWSDHLLSAVQPEHGASESEISALKAASLELHAKIDAVNVANAQAKQAVIEKNESRNQLETLIRAAVRRIKAGSNYSSSLGAHLGIDGVSNKFDIANASPTLNGVDQTGGTVYLSFNKYQSEGINVYCQREGDSGWQLLGRATVSPFVDNRPLLNGDKPELRRYTAVYMLKDKEVGKFSQDLVMTCSP